MKNPKKGFVIPLIIAIVAVLAVGGGVYYYAHNNKPFEVFTFDPNATVATTTDVTKDWKIYNDKDYGISFNYPLLWNLTTKLELDHPITDRMNFYKLTKNFGKYNLVLSFTTGIIGVGGACPDYDSKISVVLSKEIIISGKKYYFIYTGDKNINKINYSYISNNSKGECPNVAFVKVPDINGLFEAQLNLYYDDKNVDLNSTNIVGINDFNEAEMILSSIVNIDTKK